MKYCPKCGRDYPDSYYACTDGATLIVTTQKPWERTGLGRTIVSEKTKAMRRPPYFGLAAILCLITLVSVSFPFIKDALRQAVSGIKAPSSATNYAGLREGVMSSLNGWTAATNTRNLEAHMGYYADNLTAYYNHKSVTKDFVRSTRSPAFTKYRTLSVALNDVQINIDSTGTVATVTCTKTWGFSGGRRSTGSTQQRLILSHISGRWLITAEEDIKVNYANW